MKKELNKERSEKKHNPVSSKFFNFQMTIKSILFLTLLVFSKTISSQTPTNFCIKGQLVDSFSNQALSNVHIEVHNQLNQVIGNAFNSDSFGRFYICAPQPIYSIHFSYIGYHNRQLMVSDTGLNIDIKTIWLRSTNNALKGFSLKLKKEEEPFTIEKKTYSVSQNILATGGTAIDALKQIPAVNVDADGNISIRGSNNVTIYINGKQSSLSGADRQALLMQIPAANIESIDINTNPGAKQDAEGMSGIINITLKQNTSKSKNGYVTLGAGTNNKYNGTVSFNTNYKKFVFGNTLSFRQNNQWGRGYNLRQNFFNNTSSRINQFSNGEYLNYNGAFSGTIDYNYSKKLTLSTNYLYSNNINNDEDLNKNLLSNAQDSIYQIIERVSKIKGNNYNIDAGLSMRKTFDKSTHNLIGMVNFSRTFTDNTTNFVQNELNTISETVKSPLPYLLNNSNNNIYTTRLAQIDYTKPYHTNIKFETGLKYTGRSIDNDFYVDSFNHSAQKNQTDSAKSNHFLYDEKVSAAYAMISHTLNSIVKYNLGLRFENTDIKGQQLTSNESFANNYSKLFPSGSINFTLQKKYKLPDIQLSYSKRINRPGQRSLNPFLDFSDPYNLSKGNPNLKPEMTNALELSAIYNTKKNAFTATFYARQTNQPISRFRTIDSNGISMVSQINLGYNRSTGGEIVAKFSLFKALKVTMNGNLYKYIVAGNVTGNDFINQRVAYSGKANLNYQFWKKTDLQASFFYMGPNVTAQGQMKAMYGLEIGGKKDLIKDKLTLGLTLADVFNNRRFAMHMSDATFNSDFYRKRESRILTFNLTWKFGKLEGQASEKKPRSMERPADMDF